jgi:Ca-activated chloride channel family protein
MRRIIAIAFAALAVAAPASSQGWIEPLPGRIDPGVVKLRTAVTVRVTDRVARVEVEEWFQNRAGRGLGEGDYLYPLPGEAVFSNFSLFQGDQELRGETMDAGRARAIYEEIVRRKKDPALIELVGHGLVRARVFPINPGETRKVTMRYTQVLKRSGDALHFRYAAGGRFAGIAPAGREGPQGAQRAAEPAPLSFTLVAEDGALFRDAFSPTHDVRVTREDGRMTVRPHDRLDGDFALFLPLSGERVGLTLATHRPSSEDGYFMLTLSPGDVAEATTPRDITIVVDASGSMSGEKMEQARGALRQLLGTLSERDRFRLIRFSSGVDAWRTRWTPATSAELRLARQWVDALVAEGGTNISGALAEAFRAETPESRLPVVVFMTDGLPSAGETNAERIAAQAERDAGRARIFAFGVGYDVNTLLLDRLGSATRGTTQYVQPGEDVELALGVLAARIRHPVLTDLAIADAPVRLREIYPVTLPDLFAGEELILFGRYEGAGSGRIAIAGRRDGRAERYATAARFADHDSDNDFIPRLWASRKLGSLAQQVRLNGPDPELVEEIRSTALRYGLLSEYTSYLVQEPELVVASRDSMAQRLQRMAAAPVAGEAAVRRSEDARAAGAVRSLGDLVSAQKAAYESAAANAADVYGARATRTIGGRVFRQTGGEWIDALHRAGARVVEIEAFSPAYFALLRRLPELAEYWKELPAALVAGREAGIRVGPRGLRQLSDAELGRIAAGFRF